MNAPSRLGRYEIRGELGRGAMGVVYEGFDPGIERTVAIKLLQLDQAADTMTAELRTRFRREAQSAGRLSHPNIVTVHEYCDGEAQVDGSSGCPYIVMELVAGRTLKSLFDAHHRFTLNETAQLMGDLLAALQHAHARGVVHRDIKPSNLIVLDGGPPSPLKVADFGIARIDHSDLTLTGTTLGTTSHMSPEQFLGQPVDRRTDLYACGVILYQFLTGELPFTGSPSTIMQKVLNQEVLAPSVLNPTLVPGWDAIVRKALAKRAGDRYESAAAMADAIQVALTGVDPDATVLRSAPPATRRSHSNRTIVAGVAAACIVAISSGVFIAARRQAPSIQDHVEVPAAAVPVVRTAPVPSGPSIGPPAQQATHVPAPSADEIEQQAWVEASNADSAAAYRAFLQGYPKGRFTGRARVRLAVLEPKLAAPAPIPPAARGPTLKPSAAASGVVLAATPLTTRAASASQEKTAAPSRQSCQEDPGIDRRCALVLGYYHRSETKDLSQAMKWFRSGAEQGDARAQYEVAMMYYRGQGVARNNATGFDWAKKAAEQGFAMAQNRVGVSFERGEGVAQNVSTALEWYRKAAAQGESYAQNNLGRMLLFVRGVPQDPGQAYEFFGRAAAQGNPYAAYNLAYMFENGVFVTADKRTAARWYRTSLGSGLEAAVLRDGGTETKTIEHARAFITANP